MSKKIVAVSDVLEINGNNQSYTTTEKVLIDGVETEMKVKYLEDTEERREALREYLEEENQLFDQIMAAWLGFDEDGQVDKEVKLSDVLMHFGVTEDQYREMFMQRVQFSNRLC